MCSGRADRKHLDRAQDRELERPLVAGEVLRDDLRRGPRVVAGLERESRQVVDPVRGADPQRRPAVLPRTARAVGVVEHDEAGTAAPEVVRAAQPGLAGSDDHHVNLAHTHPNIDRSG
ncbi:hypothetical protein GCM10010470_32150 [Saccharopolyspora taberi]|uniref:Uncharacterized protein n=1 Tax=Saccharopolyspora taberi TaxID=60895 RepID=A0ABN3VEB6_9PSEU